MTHAQMERELARATGESVSTLRSLGFQPVEMADAEPLTVDWEAIDEDRLAIVPDRPPKLQDRGDVMQLIISPTGIVRCIYAEEINLSRLGELAIRRASHVEPTATGQWVAELSPVAGPTLGPFSSRSLALAAEAAWLETNWLMLG